MALSKDLDQFILDGVEGLSDRREKGRGCYGAVYEVRLNGVPCIAKRLHDILVGRGQEEPVSEEGKSEMLQRFRKECVLLSGLRHPNIVQMLGVHCGGDEADISLIMEYMHMDLEHCMETYPDIPLPYKISILRDVAYGLAYLHSLNIIHRDLNAGNVLLMESLKAKIADLGVAKLLDRETAMIRKITFCPGAPDFMPPEAFERSPKYDAKLDTFSFGHLAIYLVNEEVPRVSDSMIMVEDVQKNQRQVGKRRQALDQMGGPSHPLYFTVVQCLSDTPNQRPTSRDLVKTMEKICKQHLIPHENTLHMLAEIRDKVKVETQLTQRIAQEGQQSKQLRDTIKCLESQLQKSHDIAAKLSDDAEQLRAMVDTLIKESASKSDQITSFVERQQVCRPQ